MKGSVLSIQSHVVHGCVGNNAAVFPLQLLGFNVNAINSVQFSNHTGYPVVKGSVLGGNDLDSLIDGLAINGLAVYDYVLTGYIGSESFLSSVIRVLDTCRKFNSNMKYVCDPVLGDNGKLYVPKELIEIYKRDIIPRAYMITPNQMEAELLTGLKIENESCVLQALQALYKMGPQIVVITSSEIADAPGMLSCYIMSVSGDHYNISCVQVKKLNGKHFTGTGDLTAALLLAWTHSLKGSHVLGDALKCSIGTVQAILTKALQRYEAGMNALTCNDLPQKAIECRLIELPIVECKADIESPVVDSISVRSWQLPVTIS